MSESRAGLTSDEDNVGALIEAWRAMVGRLPGHTIARSADVATAFANASLPLMNLSILDRPTVSETDFGRALGVARERAEACEHGSLVVVCPSWAPPEWRRIAAGAGLVPSDSITGMATDALAASRRTPPLIEYRLVRDPATATDIAVVNARAYGMPVEMAECISHPDVWTKDTFGVVGYVREEAVTCTAAFVIGEMIYIALVATLPTAHGQGYAEAVMRRAIQYAQDAVGPKRIWLHATEMGRPLYRSMGFATGAELTLFAFSDGAPAH
jgi:GNAT superfamily N-acetyltransferase